MLALLTLNIERFFALTHPIFHRKSVTKERLLFLLGFMTVLLGGQIVMSFLNPKLFANVLTMIYPCILLILSSYLNYKMFMITKSKRKVERVVPRAETLNKGEIKRHQINFRKIATCSLAVISFFICSFPQIVYSSFRLTSDRPFHDRQVLSFNIWSITFVSMNSTFNCVIFFWRNLILRREGIKIVKSFSARF